VIFFTALKTRTGPADQLGAVRFYISQMIKIKPNRASKSGAILIGYGDLPHTTFINSA